MMLALLSEMALAETETPRERILSGLTEANKREASLVAQLEAQLRPGERRGQTLYATLYAPFRS
jgi:hypothetical protein